MAPRIRHCFLSQPIHRRTDPGRHLTDVPNDLDLDRRPLARTGQLGDVGDPRAGQQLASSSRRSIRTIVRISVSTFDASASITPRACTAGCWSPVTAAWASPA